jgi:mercuric reductase
MWVWSWRSCSPGWARGSALWRPWTGWPPSEEPEASRLVQQVFAEENIEVHTGVIITNVTRHGPVVLAGLRHPDSRSDQLNAQHLLVAAGRRPITDALNLAAVGVKTGNRDEVVVDAELRTHNPRIWAAGDVTGQFQFVYVAGAHGALIGDNAFGHAGRTLDCRHLPRVIFTDPPGAAVGLTEEQALQQGWTAAARS